MGGGLRWSLRFGLLVMLVAPILAQQCSTTVPCADGCCSRFGYCGWGDDFCKDGCLNSCEAKKGCDIDRPCESGCCSKFGFCGLGPDYCDKEVCVTNCDRKATCDPGGYGAEFVESQACPLNVCCSKFGFCGLTEEFCGNKTVRRPSCPADSTDPFTRVVGYYESWSSGRPCNRFYPEQIPTGVYTHLNFAFASINPETFEVMPAASSDIEMYQRLTDLKYKDPSLKVFIAIGGWTFNDPGPTATTFSDIARSEENQKKFFKSLASFMATHNFDGIDLDWEYPGADDRSGRPDDFKNFPTFVANLKSALKATGGRDGLSITLPASYWYLQHFDIKKLQSSVDFFNIMSYDLHGVWDKPNRWVGPYLNSHTNLTEITDALDLLWRNNIPSSKVTMGLAFYGRGFTVSDPACVEPGCTFDSGANARRCSKEVSILLNSEIVDIMDQQGVKSTLDEDAAVKVLIFDENQWVTYDDEETFKKKADFARSQCLGGVMVWAVSHDTSDAMFSQALAKSAKREYTPATSSDTISHQASSPQKQCKWTGCGESCPTGYKQMLREDPTWKTHVKGNMAMIDYTGCDVNGYHSFCCPANEDLPTCGWYTENNGNCQPQCPEGTIEVGSDSNFCNSKTSYTAACCTKAPAVMHLYSQCDWSAWPRCQDGSCSNTQLLTSAFGSGAAICDQSGSNKNVVDQRKYCCDNDDSKSQWKNCKIYDNLGYNTDDARVCSNACPDDKVRLAMDFSLVQGNNDCWGYVAQCCDAVYSPIVEREDPRAAEFRDDLQYFMDHLSEIEDSTECTSPEAPDPSSGDIILRRADAGRLAKRAADQAKDIYSNIFNLFFGAASLYTFGPDIWDEIVCTRFNSICYENVVDYLNADVADLVPGYTPRRFARQMMCNIKLTSDLVSGLIGGCVCYTRNCCMTGDTECEALDEVLERLRARSVRRDSTFRTLEAPTVRKKLLARGSPEPYEWSTPDGSWDSEYFSLSFPSSGDWTPFEDMWEFTVSWGRQGDCSDVTPAYIDVTDPTDRKGTATEHGMERNTGQQFFPDAIRGVLPGPNSARPTNPIGAIPGDFFTVTLNTDLNILNAAPYSQNVAIPLARGGTPEWWPIRRMMNALGSDTNRQVMVLVVDALNLMKSNIWRYKNPVVPGALLTTAQDPNQADAALLTLRNIITSMNYYNLPRVHDRLVLTLTEWRLQLRWAERLDRALFGRQISVYAAWDQWFQGHLDYIEANVRTFVTRYLDVMDNVWQAQPLTNTNRTRQLKNIASLRRLLANMAINRVGFFTPINPV